MGVDNLVISGQAGVLGYIGHDYLVRRWIDRLDAKRSGKDRNRYLQLFYVNYIGSCSFHLDNARL